MKFYVRSPLALLASVVLSACATQVGKPMSTPVDGGTSRSAATVVPAQSQEAKLKELKRLFDANLISNEVYLERQKAILANP